MVDITHDDILPIRELARRLPAVRGGRPPSAATVYRWTTTGLRGCRLDYVQVGGVRCSSVAAAHRFFTSLSRTPDASPRAATPPNHRTSVPPHLVEIALDDAGI